MRITKEDFKTLFPRIRKFGNNLAFLIFTYTPYSLLVGFTSFGVYWLGTKIGISPDIMRPIFKILIGLLQVVPTAAVWSYREGFGGDLGITDGIMDACFAIWFAIIIAWYFT